MKVGPEKSFLGGDVKGEDVIHPLKLWEYRIGGEKRYMNVGRYVWHRNRGGKRSKTIERRKVSLADRRLLYED